MKQVTRYEAEDGKLFNSESECIKHDRRLMVIRQIDEDLHLRDTSSEEIVDWMIEKGYLK